MSNSPFSDKDASLLNGELWSPFSQPAQGNQKEVAKGRGRDFLTKQDRHSVAPTAPGPWSSSPPSLSDEWAEALLGRPLGKYLNMVKAAGESGTCRGWTEPS